MYVGKTWNPVMVAILSFITCGYFGMYHMYTVIKDLNANAGKELANPILAGIIYPYGWYVADKELNQVCANEGIEYKPGFVMWIILLFVCYIGNILAPLKIAKTLNQLWERRGGGTPTNTPAQ